MIESLRIKWQNLLASPFGQTVLNEKTMNFSSVSHFFMAGTLMMAVMPMIFPLSLPLYLSLTLGCLAFSLAFKGLARPPKNSLRGILFFAGAAFSLALSAGMLLLMPSLGVALGFMFFSVVTQLIATRFLNSPKSDEPSLNFWSKVGHLLTIAALLGVAISFALTLSAVGFAPAVFSFPLGTGLVAAITAMVAWTGMLMTEKKMAESVSGVEQSGWPSNYLSATKLSVADTSAIRPSPSSAAAHAASAGTREGTRELPPRLPFSSVTSRVTSASLDETTHAASSNAP